MSDYIDRQTAIEVVKKHYRIDNDLLEVIADEIEQLPSAQPKVTEEAVKDYCRKRCLTILTNGCFHKLASAQIEPLTDNEQRIFLAAMEREEKVCKQVDKECCREPYEDSLVRICCEITRKVKGALWTI